MAENWKNVLKSQHSDLERLQAMDAALDDDRVAADMDKILNRPSSHVTYSSASKPNTARNNHSPSPGPNLPPPPATYESSDEDPSYGDIYGKEFTPSPNKRSSGSKLMQNPLSTPSIVVPASSKAPETADRYLHTAVEQHFPFFNCMFFRFVKAKVNMLTKQLEDGLELRQKMDEQNKDLQRQLKTEREENKNLNKRFVCHHTVIFAKTAR